MCFIHRNNLTKLTHLIKKIPIKIFAKSLSHCATNVQCHCYVTMNCNEILR